jgi:SET domain-containing protein
MIVGVSGRRRISVRRSGVHGRGVFALVDIAEGEAIIEYRGEVISWDEAIARFERAGADAHTFLFDLGDSQVIDGGHGGNSARWINHGCEPNCESIETDGRIVIWSLRPIAAGDELFIDYALIAEAGLSPTEQARHSCRCAAAACRGTMLAITGS